MPSTTTAPTSTSSRRSRFTSSAACSSSVSRRVPKGAATACSSTRATFSLRWVTDGPEDQSRGLPPRGEQELELPLVPHPPNPHPDPPQGHQAPRLPED